MTIKQLSLLLFSSFLSLWFLSDQAWAQDLVLKIPVTQEGIYKITYNDIGYYGQSSGIDPKLIDPHQVHLYNRGQEVAIYVEGEEDGRFDSGDYVEFYGVAVKPEDPEYKYTEENVYWLKVNADPPVRMSSWESPGGGALQGSFLHTLHPEQNWMYWETMPEGMGLDHWFWRWKISAGSSRDYTIGLSNIATTTQGATVRVYLHGRTDDTVDPDHQTRVKLNGSTLGDMDLPWEMWYGMARGRSSMTLRIFPLPC